MDLTFGEAKNPLAPTSINTRLRYCEIMVSRASGKATKGMYGPKSISEAVSVNILESTSKVIIVVILLVSK